MPEVYPTRGDDDQRTFMSSPFEYAIVPSSAMNDERHITKSFRYRRRVLTELSEFGIIPDEKTAPALAREFLNDLYLYEIRRLRDRLLTGEFPQPEYAGRVLQLRQKYPLLSLPLTEWTEDDPGEKKEV
jgi:hypothetical protein